MPANDRLFVLTLEPREARHIALLRLDRFDTQVLQETDSPALGRVALIVTSDATTARWRVIGLAVAESAGRGSTFHRRLRVRGLRLVNGERLDDVSFSRSAVPWTSRIGGAAALA